MGRSISSCARSTSSASSAPGTGTRSSSALDNYHHMVYASAYTLPRVGVVRLRGARARRARVAAREVSGVVGRRSIRSGSGSPTRWRAPIRATTSPCTAPRSSASAICASSCCANGTPRATPRDVAGSRRAQATSSAPSRAGGSSSSEPERYAAHKDVVQARARGRGAREPAGAGAAVLRARLRDLGQGRVRRRLPLAGKVGERPKAVA